MLPNKKTGLLLLSTVIMFQTAQVVGQDGGIEDVAGREYYSAHAIGDEVISPVSGESYYQYQWALKNNGTLRRISSANRSGQGAEAYGPSVNLTTDSHGEGNYVAEEQITAGVAGVDIDIENAWNVYEQTTERRAVTVALIDTGVDTAHPDLRNSIWVNTDEIPGDGIDNDHNGYVDDVNGWNFHSGNNQLFHGGEDNHGTHGAGYHCRSLGRERYHGNCGQ